MNEVLATDSGAASSEARLEDVPAGPIIKLTTERRVRVSAAEHVRADTGPVLFRDRATQLNREIRDAEAGVKLETTVDGWNDSRSGAGIDATSARSASVGGR